MRTPTVIALLGSILVAVAPLVPVIPETFTFYPPLYGSSSESLTLLESRLYEALALFLLAALSAGLALSGRERRSWIPALLVAASSVWTWWVLQADFTAMVRDLPGGVDAYPFDHWIRPWPWLLLGSAVAFLGAASWRSYRDARLAHDAAIGKVFE